MKDSKNSSIKQDGLFSLENFLEMPLAEVHGTYSKY